MNFVFSLFYAFFYMSLPLSVSDNQAPENYRPQANNKEYKTNTPVFQRAMSINEASQSELDLVVVTPGLSVSSDSNLLMVLPGDMISYTVVVKNESDRDESIEITLTSFLGWAKLENGMQSNLTLKPQEHIDLQVIVDIPDDILPGQYDQAIVIVNSLSIPGRSDAFMVQLIYDED